MARRRNHHPVHQELTSEQWIDLLSNERWESDAFESEKKRYQAWLANREEFLQGSRPGSRPGAWWRFEAPEGAPKIEDYPGSYSGVTNRIEPDPEGDLWTDEFDFDRLRFLASHGLLSDDEIAALLAQRDDPDVAPYVRELAERKADAVLEGLAEGQSHRNE